MIERTLYPLVHRNYDFYDFLQFKKETVFLIFPVHLLLIHHPDQTVPIDLTDAVWGWGTGRRIP